MLVFRFIHSAMSERLAGDPTRSVIDLNTAIEIMIRVTISEGAESAGLTAAEARSAEDAGARKRVSKYLAKICDLEEIDVGDRGTPWGQWFADGYMLRNAAVHQGQAVDREALDRAFEQAGAVVADLKGRLEGRPESEFQNLGRKLALQFSGAGPSSEDEVLPISFPWE